MKKILFALATIALLASCSGTTYSSQLKEEKKIISNWLKRENVNVITEVPADDKWGEKDYLKVPEYDYMYFHLITRGDSIRTDGVDTVSNLIVYNDKVVLRYKRFTLTYPSDTDSYWSELDNPYPIVFQYQNDATNACVGWHTAVQYMKYPGSECVLICPSKRGFTTDQNTVTPYGYIMKIQVKD